MKIGNESKNRLVSSLTPLLNSRDTNAHRASLVLQSMSRADGGPGSGNWGHEGRPGEVGGSAEGGGKHNRIEKRGGSFTSFSKRQKKLAQPHKPSTNELIKVPTGTKILGYDGGMIEKFDSTHFFNTKTGDIYDAYKMHHVLKDKDVKLAIPKSSNKNYQKYKAANFEPGYLTAETLDGFPDNAVLEMPNGKQYKNFGNGLWIKTGEGGSMYTSSTIVKELAQKENKTNGASSEEAFIPLPHQLHQYPVGTTIEGHYGDTWEKINDTDFVNQMTGEVEDYAQIAGYAAANHEKMKVKQPSGKTYSQRDLQQLPKGTIITGHSMGTLKKISGGYWETEDGKEVLGCYNLSESSENQSGKLKIEKPGDKPSTSQPTQEAAKAPEPAKPPKSTMFAGQNGCKHSDSCFTEERRKNAKYFEDPKDADNMLRAQCGELWQTLDYDTKDAFRSYTGGGYQDINECLRANKSDGYREKQIKNMTATIAKSELPIDMILPRGSSRGTVSKMLGCDPEDLGNPDFLAKLVGKTMSDDGFLSCGSCKGKGMTKKCRLEIYAPKGTKAIYAEPFSTCGNGKGMNWDSLKLDGKSTQSSFSSEFETILQRGTRLRITEAHLEGEGFFGQKTVIRCEVVEQKPFDL